MRGSAAQAQGFAAARGGRSGVGGRRVLVPGPYQVPVDVGRLEVEGGVEQFFQPARDVVLPVVLHRLLLQLLQVSSGPTAAAAAFPHGRRFKATAGVSRGPASVLHVARQRNEIPTPDLARFSARSSSRPQARVAPPPSSLPFPCRMAPQDWAPQLPTPTLSRRRFSPLSPAGFLMG